MIQDPPVELRLPFTGRWLVQNSPANRVPSHGTVAFGTSYAIDFVPVDETGHSAPRTVRSWILTEPAEQFVGFGRPVLAPVSGTVVAVHDGELDHAARRAPLALLGYAFSQGSRARAGAAGLAGNHVAIEISPGGPLVLLAHLRSGSVRVRAGERISAGDQLGECGNSGNSTEPHVHVQVSDALDVTAKGIPMRLSKSDGTAWIPRTGEVVHA